MCLVKEKKRVEKDAALSREMRVSVAVKSFVVGGLALYQLAVIKGHGASIVSTYRADTSKRSVDTRTH